MLTSLGRFARQYQGKGYAAAVTLTIDPMTTETRISLDCRGRGFYSQGYIEDVPAQGYDSWKRGAIVGAAYALNVARYGPCHVIITKIEGLTTDTNPTVVAAAVAAVMDAIWKGIGFTPPTDVSAYITAVALDSWNQPYDTVPNFHPNGDA